MCNLFIVIIDLVSRLEHWQQREAFENIKHCLAVFSLPDFGPYRNNSGLLHLEVCFNGFLICPRQICSALFAVSSCLHVTVSIHVLVSGLDTDY